MILLFERYVNYFYYLKDNEYDIERIIQYLYYLKDRLI